jgi:hypothetical protein
LDLVADVYWGIHTSTPKDAAPFQTDLILEKVLTDYALVGRVPIDAVKERAKQNVRSMG